MGFQIPVTLLLLLDLTDPQKAPRQRLLVHRGPPRPRETWRVGGLVVVRSQLKPAIRQLVELLVQLVVTYKLRVDFRRYTY